MASGFLLLYVTRYQDCQDVSISAGTTEQGPPLDDDVRADADGSPS